MLKFFLLLNLLVATALLAQVPEDDLKINPGEDGDAYIRLSGDGEGLYLYVRNKAGLGSVLITESSADPEKQNDSFALRAWEYNTVNGDESRILNGQLLLSDSPLYFLVDSTPEPNEILGTAFRIFIPFDVTYGYPWSREGQLEIRQGTWLNIRTFSKPFADYSGSWKDNPVLLNQTILPPPREFRVLKEVENVDSFSEALESISTVFSEYGDEIDVVLVVDTTISMKEELASVKKDLVPYLRNIIKDNSSFRIGLVLYKDYKEVYVTKTSPFAEDLDVLQDRINRITVSGGRDYEEAVSEALYAALTEYDWQAPNRFIIQVGDAPGHSTPRGSITQDMVEEEAGKLGVSIRSIRLPSE